MCDCNHALSSLFSTEGQEESTPKTQSEDASDGDPTVAPGEDAPGKVMEIDLSTTIALTELSQRATEAYTEGPTVEENPSGGSENSSVGSTFIPGEFDQPAGSGMMPPNSAEEGASPTAPVGQPEETQPVTENEREIDIMEPEGERKKNTGYKINI